MLLGKLLILSDFSRKGLHPSAKEIAERLISQAAGSPQPVAIARATGAAASCSGPGGPAGAALGLKHLAGTAGKRFALSKHASSYTKRQKRKKLPSGAFQSGTRLP